MKKIIITTILFLLPLQAMAISLVGSSTSTTEPIRAGIKYKLPSLYIRSASTTFAGLNVALANDDYYTENNLLKPNADWFSFAPSKKVHLNEDELREVKVSLMIPHNDQFEIGDYFCFLEVIDLGPDPDGGGTKVMTAVGRKMNFNVNGKATMRELVKFYLGNLTALVSDFKTIIVVVLISTFTILGIKLFTKKFSFQIQKK